MNKAEKLYDAITNLPDEMVERAQSTPLREVKRPAWGRWAALAACFCLVVGGGLIFAHTRMGGGLSGGSSPGLGETNDGSNGGTVPGDGTVSISGSGHDEGSVFMSYAGPVFPLTTKEDYGLSAERTVTMDFANYAVHEMTRPRGDGTMETYQDWSAEIQIKDGYVLTNPTGEDVTVTALYPFVSSFPYLQKLRPEIRVNGQPAGTELLVGGYCGGFQGMMGGESDDSGLYNLKAPTSWEDYRDKLADGGYLAGAFLPPPDLSEPVIVYSFDDAQAPTDQYQAATLGVSFTIDPARTSVYAWSFNGMSWDDETGERQYSFFVDKFGRWQPRYLIIQGDDIDDYTVQGYENGGCETEIDGVSATITRQETTFGEIMKSIVANYRESQMCDFWVDAQGVSEELLYRAAAQSLVNYANTVARYDGGRLDDVVSDAAVMERVFYLSFDVTIPAGGSAEIAAEFTKGASYDFDCGSTENQDVYGYDLVTALGSVLAFMDQRAELVNTDQVEIVRQNFGFDPKNGVTSVALDGAQEHYYLEVRRVP